MVVDCEGKNKWQEGTSCREKLRIQSFTFALYTLWFTVVHIVTQKSLCGSIYGRDPSVNKCVYNVQILDFNL